MQVVCLSASLVIQQSTRHVHFSVCGFFLLPVGSYSELKNCATKAGLTGPLPLDLHTGSTPRGPHCCLPRSISHISVDSIYRLELRKQKHFILCGVNHIPFAGREEGVGRECHSLCKHTQMTYLHRDGNFQHYG